MTAYYHSPFLPWSADADEERRFKKIVLWTVGLVVLLSMVMPFLPTTKKDREDVTEVPPRLAKLVIERKQPPPPPPKKIEKKEEKPKPEKKKVEKKKEKPKEKPKVAEKKPKPQTKTREKAREKAKTSGVLAFADDLADLRANPSVNKLSNNKLSTGGGQAKQTKRSIVTSNVGQGSGGINTASLSRDTGGSQLSGRTTSKVTSSISTSSAATKTRTKDGRLAGRTQEEIALVFDRNKSKIDAVYRRATRKDPTLQGKVVLRITIAPSGQVTNVQVVSSELNNPDLERKLVLTVKRFNFGAKNVADFVGTFPIDFFPS